MRRPLALVVVGFWLFFTLFGAVQTHLSMITHGHSFLRIFFYQLAVWGVWVLLTPLVAWLGTHVPVVPFNGRAVLLHSLFMLLIGVGHVAAWMQLTIAIRPYDHMTISEFSPYFARVLMFRVPIEILIYLAVLAVAQAIEFYAVLRDRELSLSEARLHALELQIQPHFLFNTLHAIGGLVRNKRNDEAVEMIAGLSDLLRYSLDHAGSARVPLEKETQMLERYLGIQQVRFADRLTVSIDVPEDVQRARVPMLILQPLAENAIRHGIAMSAGAGRVDVRAYRDGAKLHIEMRNTGTLREAPKGLGLRNTEDRLRQLYGEGQSFALRGTNDGVVAELMIPWSEA